MKENKLVSIRNKFSSGDFLIIITNIPMEESGLCGKMIESSDQFIHYDVLGKEDGRVCWLTVVYAHN